MKMFADNGTLQIPSPIKLPTESDKSIVVKRLFCHKGHSLITKRAKFNGHAGVYLKVRAAAGEGLLFASAIYGDRSLVVPELDLVKGELLEFFCPVCGEKLPVYAPCQCGGDLIALFPDEKADFANSIGICNRAGCYKSQLILNNELVPMASLEDRPLDL